MKRLSVKIRVVLGLVGLNVSLIILASYVGVIPDRAGAMRQGRAALAESIALHATALVMRNDVLRLESDFEMMAERNADLLTLALRRQNGTMLIATGDHKETWHDMQNDYSRDTQVRVPIWAGKHKWGQLEMRFESLSPGGPTGILAMPIVQLTLFMGALGFIAFYFYLGKVLRQLDPSKAIPGRVRTALDTLAEGLMVIDRKEQIVLANKSFAKLLGKSPEKLLGCRVGDLPWINTEGIPIKSANRPWIQAMQQGTPEINRLLRLRLSDQEWLTFNINCSPVLGAGGKYAGVLVSLDDVTQLEKKEIELRKSKDEAEAANQAKSTFLANMSHEIRTPMNAILGFTEILKRGYAKNRQDNLRYLNTIHSSGKNLLELINDILDLSKVESGRIEMEETWVQPHHILHEVIQILKIAAGEKGLELRFEAQTALPEKITTDPTRFRQIIFNLVGNAIKFTEHGYVQLTCRLEDTQSGPQLQILISDTGVGIARDKLESIFDPFTQEDTTTTRRFGGTGLGLSISREFARALGGDITVDSVPGKGSTFKVTLATGSLNGVAFLEPDSVSDIALGVDEGEQARWQFPDARVLVVDDGAENRELIRLLLEESGLNVDEAENGQIGMQKATERPYDIILMDVNMPVMDGFTATRKLRQKGLQTTIIALTANAMKGFEKECIDNGYSGYLTKPIDIDRFMQMMADQLNGQRIEGQAGDTPKTDRMPEAVAANDRTVDLAPVVSTLPASNARFRNLISRFADRLNNQLNDLDQALSRGDLSEVAAIAHWLKGAGGTVGFDVFTEPAGRLESLAKANGDPNKMEQAAAELHSLAQRLVISGGAAAAVYSIADERPVQSAGPETAAVDAKAKPTAKPICSRLADNPRLHRVILNFIKKLDEQLASMEQAYQEDNWETLAMLALWLKGAGGTVGYDEFTEPATELENFARSHQSQRAGQVLEDLKRMARAIVPPQNTSGPRVQEKSAGDQYSAKNKIQAL